MKKIDYQAPELKIKTLFMNFLMQASGVTGDNGIGYGGSDNTEDGLDADAKGFGHRSVWDD